MNNWSRLLWRLVLSFLLIGIAKSAFGVWKDIQRTETSVSWPKAEGSIVKVTDVNTQPWRGKHPSDQIVEYEFAVEGATYLGRTISFSRRSAWYHDEVKELVLRLAQSTSVAVYFDPQSPQNSVLYPGGSNRTNIIFFACQILAVVVFGALIVIDVKASRRLACERCSQPPCG